MGKRNRKIALLAVSIILLVALFQLVWPQIYPWVVSLNRYPSQEYYQIMGALTPNGLSGLTVIVGLILIAWVAVTDP